jgi:hypothetical protein
MFLHCEEKGAQAGEERDVNISNQVSNFKIVPIAKHHEVTDVNCVRGGDMLQLYQRSNQRYLYRDVDEQPQLFRPAADVFAGSERNAKNADLECHRADLTWQLQQPMMPWSGKLAQHPLGGDQVVYSLKDAISGKFLVELQQGTYAFSESNDDGSCHWVLKPFDSDTTAYQYDVTAFWLVNCSSGRALQQALANNLQAPDGKEWHREMAPKDNLRPVEPVPLDRVSERDLFVCRRLPGHAVTQFRKLQRVMPQLYRFGDAVQKTKKTDQAIEELRDTYLRHDEDLGVQGPVMSVLAEIMVDIIGSGGIENDVLKRDGLVVPAVQNMLCEFRFISFIFGVLTDLFDLVKKKDIIGEKNMKGEFVQRFGPEFMTFVLYSTRIIRNMAKENDAASLLLFERLEFLTPLCG